jgi:hypothetical protein
MSSTVRIIRQQFIKKRHKNDRALIKGIKQEFMFRIEAQHTT